MRLRLNFSKLIIVLVMGLIVSLAHTSLYADMLSSSTPVVAGTQGSDGTDYWGIVEAGGVTINGSAFTASNTTPSVGDLAGRDLDSASPDNTSPKTATWTITVPVGTQILENIQFSYNVGASDTAFSWGNGGGLLRYDLTVGATTVSHVYSEIGANGDGLGLDGTGPVVPAAGFAMDQLLEAVDLMMGDPIPATITLTLTADSNTGSEEFWTRGTLSASSTLPVTLQSFSID